MGAPFNTATLLPLAAKFGALLQGAFDHAVELKAAGVPFTADTVGMFVSGKLADWDPHVAGRRVLDGATRDAGARFLAGVVFNLVK